MSTGALKPGFGPKRSTMVKIKGMRNGRKVKNGTKAPRKNAAPRTVAPGRTLDQNAMKWRQLLMDPCGAMMVAPCYSGLGTGTYVRGRRNFAIGGGDTSGVIAVQFGGNSLWSFGSSTNAPVVTGGRQYAFLQSQLIAPGVEHRPLAGCVRIRYLGSESARAGLIGMLTGTVCVQPNSTTGLNVTDVLAQMPLVNRTGEVIHEVKFLPSSRDELFTLTVDNTTAYESSANCITIVYSGIPAGSLQLELTAVYEIDPQQASQMKNSMPPQSMNTTNQVLASLGPVSGWAYSHVGAPILKAAIGYAQTLVKPQVIQAVARGITYAAAI